LLQPKESVPITEQLLADPDFRQMHTYARFIRLFGVLFSKKAAERTASTWHDPRGRPGVKIERAKGRTRFIIDEKLAPDFRSFVNETGRTLRNLFRARHLSENRDESDYRFRAEHQPS
jgi:hypothetical protein